MKNTAIILLVLVLGAGSAVAQSYGPEVLEADPPRLVKAVENTPESQEVRRDFRFVRSMASMPDTSGVLYLSFIVPVGEAGLFDDEIDKLLDVRARLESWTTYRDDDVELRLVAPSPGVRIILNMNRPSRVR